MPVKIGTRGEHGFDQPLGLLSDCHRRIENFLAVLQKVAELAAGKPLDDEQRRGVETALTYFRTAAPRHTQDEEQSLFPLLRASGQSEARAALRTVETLEHQHESANAAHAQIESLYRRWIDQGSLAGPEQQRLARVLGELREMYREHIQVEDREIFPLAGEILSPEQLTRLGREMAQRRGLLVNGQAEKKIDA